MPKQTDNKLINFMIEKSQESFLMAIEVYNKPTIKFRVEGFSFFYLQCMGINVKGLFA